MVVISCPSYKSLKSCSRGGAGHFGVGYGVLHPTIPGVTWVGTGQALSVPGTVHPVTWEWRHTHYGNIWVWYPSNCGGVGVLYPANCGGVCGQGRPCPYGYGYGYNRYGRMGIVPDDSGWGLNKKTFLQNPLGPHG